MEIIPIESGPVATIGYLVFDESTKKGIIIDTPKDSAADFIFLIKERALDITAILLTHTHWDHTAEAAALQQATKAPVAVHPADEYRLIDPMAHSVFKLPFTIEKVVPQQYLNHGDIIDCGNLKFEVRHTPGHTEGSVCFVGHGRQVVFTGDTLFNESVGRTDLPGGSGQLLIESIKSQLMTLEDSYKVYSGHGPTTTIGWERSNNPFLINDSFFIRNIIS